MKKCLTYPGHDNNIPVCGYKFIGGECVSGSIHKREDSDAWFILWYDKKSKKTVKIYRYKGEKIWKKSTALKLLGQMQGAVENGTFVIEKYTKPGWTDVVPLLDDWLENTKQNITPATYKGYKSYIKNHIKPYFQKKPELMIHDIQLDILTDFLNQLPLEPKGRMNVLYCLHAFLDYAKRSRRIVAMPSFPKKNAYQLIEKKINWLEEERQLNVLEKIPEIHQPIFYFLKYHLRRPAEAMALKREDFAHGVFTICRSISDRQLINKTKTGEIHTIPCHPNFEKFIELEFKKAIISEFFFTCPSSRTKGKRYTNEILNRIWKKACKDAGEDIDMYSGLKHSSCSQYVNEKGLSESELQIITDHARIESVRRYAKTEVKRKKELMVKNIFDNVDFKKKGLEN
jgi:integrase